MKPKIALSTHRSLLTPIFSVHKQPLLYKIATLPTLPLPLPPRPYPNKKKIWKLRKVIKKNSTSTNSSAPPPSLNHSQIQDPIQAKQESVPNTDKNTEAKTSHLNQRITIVGGLIYGICELLKYYNTSQDIPKKEPSESPSHKPEMHIKKTAEIKRPIKDDSDIVSPNATPSNQYPSLVLVKNCHKKGVQFIFETIFHANKFFNNLFKLQNQYFIDSKNPILSSVFFTPDYIKEIASSASDDKNIVTVSFPDPSKQSSFCAWLSMIGALKPALESSQALALNSNANQPSLQLSFPTPDQARSLANLLSLLQKQASTPDLTTSLANVHSTQSPILLQNIHISQDQNTVIFLFQNEQQRQFMFQFLSKQASMLSQWTIDLPTIEDSFGSRYLQNKNDPSWMDHSSKAVNSPHTTIGHNSFRSNQQSPLVFVKNLHTEGVQFIFEKPSHKQQFFNALLEFKKPHSAEFNLVPFTPDYIKEIASSASDDKNIVTVSFPDPSKQSSFCAWLSMIGALKPALESSQALALNSNANPPSLQLSFPTPDQARSLANQVSLLQKQASAPDLTTSLANVHSTQLPTLLQNIHISQDQNTVIFLFPNEQQRQFMFQLLSKQASMLSQWTIDLPTIEDSFGSRYLQNQQHALPSIAKTILQNRNLEHAFQNIKNLNLALMLNAFTFLPKLFLSAFLLNPTLPALPKPNPEPVPQTSVLNSESSINNKAAAGLFVMIFALAIFNIIKKIKKPFVNKKEETIDNAMEVIQNQLNVNQHIEQNLIADQPFLPPNSILSNNTNNNQHPQNQLVAYTENHNQILINNESLRLFSEGNKVVFLSINPQTPNQRTLILTSKAFKQALDNPAAFFANIQQWINENSRSGNEPIRIQVFSQNIIEEQNLPEIQPNNSPQVNTSLVNQSFFTLEQPLSPLNRQQHNQRQTLPSDDTNSNSLEPNQFIARTKDNKRILINKELLHLISKKNLIISLKINEQTMVLTKEALANPAAFFANIQQWINENSRSGNGPIRIQVFSQNTIQVVSPKTNENILLQKPDKSDLSTAHNPSTEHPHSHFPPSNNSSQNLNPAFDQALFNKQSRRAHSTPPDTTSSTQISEEQLVVYQTQNNNKLREIIINKELIELLKKTNTTIILNSRNNQLLLTPNAFKPDNKHLFANIRNWLNENGTNKSPITIQVFSPGNRPNNGDLLKVNTLFKRKPSSSSQTIERPLSQQLPQEEEEIIFKKQKRDFEQLIRQSEEILCSMKNEITSDEQEKPEEFFEKKLETTIDYLNILKESRKSTEELIKLGDLNEKDKEIIEEQINEIKEISNYFNIHYKKLIELYKEIDENASKLKYTNKINEITAEYNEIDEFISETKNEFLKNIEPKDNTHFDHNQPLQIESPDKGSKIPLSPTYYLEKQPPKRVFGYRHRRNTTSLNSLQIPPLLHNENGRPPTNIPILTSQKLRTNSKDEFTDSIQQPNEDIYSPLRVERTFEEEKVANRHTHTTNSIDNIDNIDSDNNSTIFINPETDTQGDISTISFPSNNSLVNAQFNLFDKNKIKEIAEKFSINNNLQNIEKTIQSVNSILQLIYKASIFLDEAIDSQNIQERHLKTFRQYFRFLKKFFNHLDTRLAFLSQNRQSCSATQQQEIESLSNKRKELDDFKKFISCDNISIGMLHAKAMF